MRGVILNHRGSQRTLRGTLSLRVNQAVELQVDDSSQVGVTHRVVVDVRAVGRQVVGSNQAVEDHQVASHLAHRLHRMVLRKHRGTLVKDVLVRPILGRAIGPDRCFNHL